MGYELKLPLEHYHVSTNNQQNKRLKKKNKPNKKQKLSVTVQNFGKSKGQTYVTDHRMAGSQILEVHATTQHLILGQSRIERHQ